ncbi:hypothetical protein BKN37_13655 [Mycobacterium talmoniae]|uniref:Uncharacterized protein n=1 Tax=Mycobacterium talmoniae TaxID=1858794 RepID=A0A1S1NID2_9MYCO|nr:hypothetical protein BKN37_13655 [Mycobacterium talmoniae]
MQPTNAFAKRLAEHIRTVTADPRARVLVGARRRPQAVLMSPAADVPPAIRRILLADSAAAQAARACSDDGEVGGIAAEAGAVVAWLWRHDHAEALAYLDALIAAIDVRTTSPAAPMVLGALLDALPADMPAAEMQALLAAAAGPDGGAPSHTHGRT